MLAATVPPRMQEKRKISDQVRKTEAKRRNIEDFLPRQRRGHWSQFGGLQGHVNPVSRASGSWKNSGQMRPNYHFSPYQGFGTHPNGPMMPNRVPNDPLGLSPSPMFGMRPGSKMMNHHNKENSIQDASLTSTTPKPNSEIGNRNITELLKSLVEAGITANASVPQEEEEPKRVNEIIIEESFSEEASLKVKPSAVKIETLYNGKQCSSCGARFETSKLGLEYGQHLDWHFRQNTNKKDRGRKPLSRNLYEEVSDWNDCEVEETEKQPAVKVKDVQKQVEQPKVPSLCAGSSATEVRCFLCHDDFEHFFHQEEEEWQIRPAVRTPDGHFVHPICLKDSMIQVQEEAANNRSDDTIKS